MKFTPFKSSEINDAQCAAVLHHSGPFSEQDRAAVAADFNGTPEAFPERYRVKKSRAVEVCSNGDTVIRDRCTDAQKATHFLAIVGKDRCLSGWGGATGGASRAVWAFDHTKVNSDRVFNWVKARSEMSYVSLVDLRTYRAPKGTAHLSIYVCDENHVAAKY